jgi:hypothetical protein
MRAISEISDFPSSSWLMGQNAEMAGRRKRPIEPDPEPDPEPPSRFERIVLRFAPDAGRTIRTSALSLALYVLFTAVFVAVTIAWVTDNQALEQRGQIADARVVHTYYAQRDKEFVVTYVTGPVGKTAFIHRFQSRPSLGSTIRVRYDSASPSDAIAADEPIWKVSDLLLFSLLVPISLIASCGQWLRFRRRLRARRRARESVIRN